MPEQKLNLQKLNELFDAAENKDRELFAEQRSNILLVSGKHYSNTKSKYWERLRQVKEINQEQALRLTKNHMQRVSKLYVNAIMSKSPDVSPTPKNSKEQSDIKSAELNKAVWFDIKHKQKLENKIGQWAKDFIDIGECAVKVFWDPMAGKVTHMEQAVDEAGTPLFNEDGSPKAGRPVFEGDLVFERIWGFNLLVDPEAKSWDEARWVCVRKMVDVAELKAKVGDDEDKLKFITEGKDETYKVFDGMKGTFADANKQCMVREFYFRPCQDYPTGYYVYATDKGILFEGALPYELPFPIHYVGFDEMQTSPRSSSIIKVAKPYQIEINRASSQAAIAQITQGDDKIIYQTGAKMSAGALLPGVRGVQVSGMAPTILPGRSGNQFYEYIGMQIAELYQAVMLNEVTADKQDNADPFTTLFKSMKDKAHFVTYCNKFANFLVGICEAALQNARIYYTDDMLVPAIGKTEYINMKEFRGTEPLCYKIKVVPMSDDIEQIWGKQMMINHTLQYAGSQLGKEDIGRLIRNAPMGNLEESFSDLTLSYDTATNIILALDRGDQPYIPQFGDKKYYLNRIEARITQADFPILAPQIQQMYGQVVQQLNQMIAQEIQQLKMLESEMIPTGGGRCKVDYYTETRPGKIERATLPIASVEWIIQRLAQQGETQASLSMLEQGGQAAVSQAALELMHKNAQQQARTGAQQPQQNPAA